MPTYEMVNQYTIAVSEMTKAYGLLSQARARLSSVVGPYHDDVIPHRPSSDPAACCDEALKAVHRNMWRGIVKKTEIKKILSEKRATELDKLLEDGKLPEITLDTVTQFLANLRGNAGDYFKEACCEVFDFLRPRRSEYKTNTEFEIGDRVILNYMIDCDKWGYVSLNYHREQKILALDNVFHMLDGKGSPKYPGDAITGIMAAIANHPRSWSCETPYFEIKWHKKGSMHIKFKRSDLVKRLNAIAGGNRLKQNTA